MTVPPDGLPAAVPERLLFTPGPRLGWTFRDRRQLAARYPGPRPDPEAAGRRLAVRRDRAERSWRFSLRWVARPLLPLAVGMYGLGALAREAAHRTGGSLTWLPYAVGAVGILWPAACLARLVMARVATEEKVQQAAVAHRQ